MWSGFAYTNGDSNGCSIGHGYGNSYSDTNTYRIADTEDYPNTAAASYSASSPVSRGAYIQVASGTR